MTEPSMSDYLAAREFADQFEALGLIPVDRIEVVSRIVVLIHTTDPLPFMGLDDATEEAQFDLEEECCDRHPGASFGVVYCPPGSKS